MQAAKGCVLQLSTDGGETWTEVGTLAGEISHVFEEEEKAERIILVGAGDPRLQVSKMFLDALAMPVAYHHELTTQRTGKGERKRNRKDRWK